MRQAFRKTHKVHRCYETANVLLVPCLLVKYVRGIFCFTFYQKLFLYVCSHFSLRRQILRRRQIEENPFLHNYPEFFFLDPPSLRHMVTFNISTVTQSFSVGYFELGFNCGLMDGDDDSFIVNSTDITVILQDGRDLNGTSLLILTNPPHLGRLLVLLHLV